MEPITCIIVDDEPMALNLVESYVKKTSFLQLVQKCSSAVEALELLQKQKIDLIYLDIQMPDLSGMELSKMLPFGTRVIFTTAFDQYALEGFKVQAIDYLLKPFDYAEFIAATNKARDWFALVKSEKQKMEIGKKEFIFVKSEYKQVKIQLSEVLYFEGLKDYVKIYLKNTKKPILSLTSLKLLEKELPEEDFMRVHRSFIVALKNIELIERSQIIINEERITVSEHYKPKFIAFLEKYSLNNTLLN